MEKNKILYVIKLYFIISFYVYYFHLITIEFLAIKFQKWGELSLITFALYMWGIWDSEKIKLAKIIQIVSE